MNAQSTNKTLIILIGILLAANVVLLSFFLFNKNEPKKQERRNYMQAYLKTEVGFDAAQMVQYDTLNSQHRRRMKEMFDIIRKGKAQSFKNIGLNNFSDSAITNAVDYSATQQKEIEMNMLKHLKDIRGLCTPAQQNKFDTGFYKVLVKP
ncbi:MAG: hypothetical protein EOO88_50075, partial [Pedobacter sp.]